MTTFMMYTNPIRPNNQVYMIPNISINKYEKIKELFAQCLSKDGRKHVELNLTTTMEQIHYDIKCYRTKEFVDLICKLYPIKSDDEPSRMIQLKNKLQENNIDFYWKNSREIVLKYYFFDETDEIIIFLDENEDFEVSLYINDHIENIYHGYAYNEDFKQPHSFTYYKDKNENPLFTIEQLVTLLKIIDDKAKKIAEIKEDLPF